MSFPQKQFLVTTLLSVLLSSTPLCFAQRAPGDEVAPATNQEAAALIGTYVGFFGPHKITLSIEKIVGKSVMGYSIVTANERAFSGSWQILPEGISFLVREPGDHPEDGNFSMTFNVQTKTLTGLWEPNDKNRSSVEMTLQARKFKYDPKVGQYPKTSTKLLKVADVENMKPAELRIMRNEIYARHGYSFIIEDMQKHFANVDWYMPVALDVTAKLTPIETKNADLIKRYENYGAKYYDRFGR